MEDKASILKSAQKFLSKGQVDKAVAEGEKLVRSFPDSNTFNFLGDLYLKKGDRKKACETYHKTARAFRDDGFSLKALATYKKVLNIDPSDSGALFALGELNEEKNIASDAIKFYLASADSFVKGKKKDDAQKVYERILKLASDNVPLRTRITEMMKKQGFSGRAASEYREMGKQFENTGEFDKAKDFFIKSLDANPGSRQTMLDLSRIAEKTGDLGQAMNYVKIAVERTGESPDLLLRHAQILKEKGSHGEAQGVLEKVLEGSPEDIEARKLKAELCLIQGDEDGAWEIYNPLLDDMIVAEQMDEAKEILERMRDKDPIEVGRKLVTIHRNTEDKESVARELVALARAFETKGMMQDALAAYKETLAIRPENTEIKDSIKAIEQQLQPEDAPEMPVMSGMPEDTLTAPPAAGEEDLEPAAQLDEEAPDEALTEIDVFLRYGLYDEARERLEPLKAERPEDADVRIRLKTLYRETHEVELAVTECIVLAEIYGRMGDDESRRASILEAYGINPGDPRMAGKLEEIGVSPEEAAAQAVAPGGTEEAEGLESYESDLTEAEFYVNQGFYQEAASIYERLNKQFPANSEIRERLDRVQNALSGEAAPASENAGKDNISFEELFAGSESGGGGEKGGPSLDSEVLEVFEEFKKGLEDQVEAGDTETHYNLAIAYKEMGLLDDAISTLQAARKDPDFFVQASTMLGNCYMEKDLHSLAINAFQDVLAKIDPNDESAWSVKYDLAAAFEKEGKLEEALRHFTEVYGWNSSFREVSEKIDGLKKSVKPADTPEEPSGGDKGESAPPKRNSRVSYI
ncbi:MAG: tetratricopeptide repeat protein [Nitrospirota bacterium]|jgi:tetratricopeptide (TPR) repeat protein